MQNPYSALSTLLLLLMLSGLLRAQDPHFMQWQQSIQLANPALTGVIPGQLRAAVAYQELYASVLGPDAYRSAAAGLELRRPAGNGNFFGLGVQLQRDEAGAAEYTRAQGLLGLSYQQQLSGGGRRGRGPAHYLAGGAQLGFGQRGIDLNKVWFSEQYFVDDLTREAYVDRAAPSGEPIGGTGRSFYTDVNAGLAWFASFGERSGAYAGGAVYHLNRPNLSAIQGAEDQLAMRQSIVLGGELPLGQGYASLLPAARAYVQGPSFTAQGGVSYRYTQRAWREVALRLGTYANLATAAPDGGAYLEAVTLLLGLETDGLQLGLSYDLTFGAIDVITRGRGGFELTATWTQAANYRQRVICPKF